jgi:hypothetical protein
MIRILSFFFICLIFGHVSHATASEPTSPTEKFVCGDILERLHVKPQSLLFVKCEETTSQQGRLVSATYRTRGTNAIGIEALLVRIAHMPRLKRSCCQWGGAAGRLRGKDGRDYMINMVSEETDVKHRSRWQKINEFEVVVSSLDEF